MPWLALVLEVDAVAADGLGEALIGAGAQSVTVDHPLAERCELTALFEMDQEPETALRRAAAECGLPTVPSFTLGRVEDDDWVHRTQAQFQPMLVRDRLWLGPRWHEPPPGWPGAVVRIDPGLAFGTGTHPSTRLVLEHLADTLHAGDHVLDYGCGSGILAIAAAKLGAGQVDAVDIDPQAVSVAAANAAANGVQVLACDPDHLPSAVYHLVVANILAQPLILLAPLLASRCERAGHVALSGILEKQAAEVADAYAPFFSMRVAGTLEGWALLAGVRR